MFSTGSSFSYSQSMNINGNPSSSIQQDMINPAPFLELLPPLLDENDQDFLLNLLLSQQQRQEQQQQQQIQCSKSSEILVMDGHDAASNKSSATNNVSTRSGKKTSCKRRSGKKDRHSKIYTAQGPRDRRMRLSLPTATKFFDLQDMLGFDKASKTIEWLFSKSKAAVMDLTCGGGGRCVSSSSESEAVSIVKMSSIRDGEVEVGDAESCGNVVGGEEEKEKEKKKKKKKLVKQGQLLQTKESRDRARARARERTMEQKKIKQDLGSCSSQEMNEATSDELLRHQMDSVNIMEKLLGTRGQSPSSIFNCGTTYNIGISRSDWTKSKDIVIPGNWGSYNDSYYSALTNTKPLPGNPDHHHQVQNPSAIFATNPNDQQQRRVSTLQQNPTLNSQEQNPNSALYPSFSEQNPAGYYPGFASPEIVLHPDHQFLQQDNHFSENSNFPSEYGCYSLY